MGDDKTNLSLGGPVFLLFLLFLGLKLAGAINWSWWWVTSPLWICGILLAMLVTAALLSMAFFK